MQSILLEATRGLGRTVLLVLAVACSGPGSPPLAPNPDPQPSPDPGPAPARVVYLVSHPDSLNGSEKGIRDLAAALTGLPVVLVDDHAFRVSDLEGCRLVLMSKNVDDNVIGNRLKATPCGILFWEENQQQLRMLATMDNDGSDGGVWHTHGRAVWIPPDAPAELSDGLSGMIDLFDRVDEMAFGRRDQVPESAMVVVEYKEPGNHKVVYAYERGATLADGTPAAGRRIFFGLYRDNFPHLTPEARRLFDAALLWAAR